MLRKTLEKSWAWRNFAVSSVHLEFQLDFHLELLHAQARVEYVLWTQRNAPPSLPHHVYGYVWGHRRAAQSSCSGKMAKFRGGSLQGPKTDESEMLALCTFFKWLLLKK